MCNFCLSCKLPNSFHYLCDKWVLNYAIPPPCPPPSSMSSVPEQVRVVELELTAQALRDTLREKEKEIEGTAREMRKQQADGHR